MKTLGLVTGLGMGAGIFYYKELVAAHLASGLTAQIVMVHADVRKVMALAARRESQQLASYLAGLLEQLKKGGADIGCIPAFSPQICEAELNKMTPLPLVGLLDAIVEAVQKSKHRKFLILGARVTMETELFGRLNGCEIAKLSDKDLDAAADTYKQIVEDGFATEEQFHTISRIARSAIAEGRADAVILAGTDFSFVFNESNADFPHLDGARIHIASLMRALS